jgi:predicted transcriptional regulator
VISAGRSPKRSKADLFARVLEVITQHPEGVRITKLSYGVGVPVDRLRQLVQRLCSYGLVMRSENKDGIMYSATKRGLEFLDTYWKMKGFLEEFGEGSTN